MPLPELPAGVQVLRLDRRVSVGAARNAALPEVTTPYVVFVDADDRLLPGTLSFLAGALDESPELVAAVTRQLHWDPATGERSETGGAPRPVVYRIARFRRLLALCTLRFNIFPIVGCAAIRTDAVRVERRLRRRQSRRGLGALLGARLARAGSASTAGPGASTPSRTARSGTEPTTGRSSRRSTEASATGSSPTPPCLAGLASFAAGGRAVAAPRLDRMFREGAYHPRPGVRPGAGIEAGPGGR